jgi:hypothetical protein
LSNIRVSKRSQYDASWQKHGEGDDNPREAQIAGGTSFAMTLLLGQIAVIDKIFWETKK